MVIDYTLLLDETDESAVTSRYIDEVFVTMPACLSGIFSSLWTQNWKMVHLSDGKSEKEYRKSYLKETKSATMNIFRKIFFSF